MKTLWKYILAIGAIVLLLGGAAYAYAAPATAAGQARAAQATPPAGAPAKQAGPGFGRGHGGGGTAQVTAVSAGSLTATTADGRTITATLASTTQVMVLATGSAGSLSDIKVGDQVRVMGRPDQSGALAAEAVVILPAGDEAQGKVTAVAGAVLTLENRDGTLTVTTDSTTTYRLAAGPAGTAGPAGPAGTLADVSAGKFVEAFGQKQADGSVLAKLVLVSDQPTGPGGRGGPGGHCGQPGGDGLNPAQPSATAAPQS